MSVEKGTRFTWKIEDYDGNQSITSQLFSSHSTKWYASMDLGLEHLSIRLYNTALSDTGEFNFSCAILDVKGAPIMWTNKLNVPFRKKKVYDSDWLVEFVFNITNTTLNTVLVLQFVIWKDNDDLVAPYRLFARTLTKPRNIIVKKEFDWAVTRITSFITGQFKHHTVYIENKELLTVLLTMSKENLFKLKLNFNFEVKHSNCKVYLCDTSGQKIILQNMNSHKYQYDLNLTKSNLLFYQNHLLCKNVMQLHFELELKDEISYNCLVDEKGFFGIDFKPYTPKLYDFLPEQVRKLPETNQPAAKADEPQKSQTKSSSKDNNQQIDQKISKKCNDLVDSRKLLSLNDLESTTANQSKGIFQDLQNMYQKAYLSDFCLQVQDKKFQVHKNILGSRSSVFDAMFSADMKEKEDNSVEISDFDASTIQRMLDYIYMDRVDKGLDWKEHSELYAAADKYNLAQLKKTCSILLQDGLTASNVLYVLKIADMHQGHELKEAVLEYISRNDKEVVGTDDWTKFAEENSQLAFGAIQALYLKKMDKK